MSTTLRVVIIIITLLVLPITMTWYNYKPQDSYVFEQYLDELNGETIDVFQIFDTEKDIIDIDLSLNLFKEQYPNYTIIEYKKIIKVRDDRAYETLVIFARRIDNVDKDN